MRKSHPFTLSYEVRGTPPQFPIQDVTRYVETQMGQFSLRLEGGLIRIYEFYDSKRDYTEYDIFGSSTFDTSHPAQPTRVIHNAYVNYEWEPSLYTYKGSEWVKYGTPIQK